jgi:hypothetical protein
MSTYSIRVACGVSSVVADELATYEPVGVRSTTEILSEFFVMLNAIFSSECPPKHPDWDRAFWEDIGIDVETAYTLYLSDRVSEAKHQFHYELQHYKFDTILAWCDANAKMPITFAMGEEMFCENGVFDFIIDFLPNYDGESVALEDITAVYRRIDECNTLGMYGEMIYWNLKHFFIHLSTYR